jgi:hypothetical protein
MFLSEVCLSVACFSKTCLSEVCLSVAFFSETCLS